MPLRRGFQPIATPESDPAAVLGLSGDGRLIRLATRPVAGERERVARDCGRSFWRDALGNRAPRRAGVRSPAGKVPARSLTTTIYPTGNTLETRQCRSTV